jgi:mRNA interferase MazF
MITSAENAPWPHDVSLSASLERTGLRAPSVVRPSKLATIEASHAEPLGDVDRVLLDLVLGALGEQMGVNSTEATTP